MNKLLIEVQENKNTHLNELRTIPDTNIELNKKRNAEENIN